MPRSGQTQRRRAGRFSGAAFVPSHGGQHGRHLPQNPDAAFLEYERNGPEEHFGIIQWLGGNQINLEPRSQIRAERIGDIAGEHFAQKKTERASDPY